MNLCREEESDQNIKSVAQIHGECCRFAAPYDIHAYLYVYVTVCVCVCVCVCV